MNKKILYSIITFLICILAFSICLANDGNPLQEATNSVRNVVGGAENGIENGVKDLGNMTKNAGNSVEGAMNSAGDKAENAMNSAGNTIKNDTSSTQKNNNSYVATRTSANGNATFMGMNATAWTWLIIGIATIAIVALVWYYSAQITNNRNNKRL